MNYAVLKYQSTDNPQNLPSEWPAEVIALGEGTDLPSQDWVLMTEAELVSHKAQYQSAYDSWFISFKAAEAAASIANTVRNKILKAMTFGNNVIAEYGVQNVLAQKTVAQIRQIAQDLAEIQTLLTSGSLYCARQAIIDFQPTELVTQADKDMFLTKLNAYLGIS